MSNRLIAILLLASTAVFADKAGLTVHGSLQLDAAGIYSERTTFDSSLAYNGMNMLTLNVKTPHLKSAKVEGLLDVYQVYGEYAKLFEADSSDEKMVVISGKAPIVVDLRMLYGALYLPWVDITLGRQIVNYGKGMVLSPLDVFSTVDLFELSFKRRGSDIAMAALPTGDVSGVDLVTEFPIGKNDYATSVRAFTTLKGWDLSAVGIYRHRSQEAIGGIAFKGDLIAGFTGELVTGYNRDSRQWRFEAMGGVDYSIRKLFLFGAEYYYQSRNRENSFYDKHNVYGSAQYVINDLMSLSVVAIGTLPAEQLIGILQYSWNILQSVNTIFYLRYYELNETVPLIPQGEAGVRVEIRF